MPYVRYQTNRHQILSKLYCIQDLGLFTKNRFLSDPPNHSRFLYQFHFIHLGRSVNLSDIV